MGKYFEKTAISSGYLLGAAGKAQRKARSFREVIGWTDDGRVITRISDHVKHQKYLKQGARLEARSYDKGLRERVVAMKVNAAKMAAQAKALRVPGTTPKLTRSYGDAALLKSYAPDTFSMMKANITKGLNWDEWKIKRN